MNATDYKKFREETESNPEQLKEFLFGCQNNVINYCVSNSFIIVSLYYYKAKYGSI